jgi:hypothetical protein
VTLTLSGWELALAVAVLAAALLAAYALGFREAQRERGAEGDRDTFRW